MSGRSSGGSELERLRQRIAQWRAAHGGAGVRWPAEFWSAVVAAARTEGVATVAATLGVGSARLAARLARASAAPVDPLQSFVEVDASRVCASSRTVLRFVGSAGDRVELELGDGATLDVVELADAFWKRGG
jgi:hypothetical protein